MTKFIGIIPARYSSTRFPGKPLALIGDKPMIEHVYRRVASALDEVVVATDDQRIFDAVKAFGGEVVMTSASHRSGTDRCREAYAKVGSQADVIINIQGDEPFIDPSQINQLKGCFDDDSVDIATLARHFDKAKGFEQLFDNNLVKLTFDKKMNALYFSRSIIPYVRNVEWKQWLDNAEFYSHVGIYAYRAQVLNEISQLEQSPLELAESLEQLRWLENGYKIRVALTDCPTIGIDTPADLEAAREYYKSL
jgi:3-deoxy-manno-octulosonate cytidylyltransferase (CMP-KDO synthetase)